MSEGKKSFAVQLTGFMSVSHSKDLSPAVKEKVLEAPEGQEVAFRKVLIDPDTNEEVVITGKAYVSKAGGLSSRVAFKMKGVEKILKDAKAPKTTGSKKPDPDALAVDLGLEVAE